MKLCSVMFRERLHECAFETRKVKVRGDAGWWARRKVAQRARLACGTMIDGE